MKKRIYTAGSILLTAAVMVFALVKYAILFFGLLKEAKNK